MRVKLRGQNDSIPIVPAFFKGLAPIVLTLALCMPALPQVVPGDNGTDLPSAVYCAVPGLSDNVDNSAGAGSGNGTGNGTDNGTGTENGTGVTGSANADGSLTVRCSAPGITPTLLDVRFAAETVVPPTFVLSGRAPLLPPDIFNGLSLGTLELRKFVRLAGGILSSSLIAVQANAPFPTVGPVLPGGTASLAIPTGTLINQVRIQVSNITVTRGQHTTMMLSGTVLPSDSTAGSNGQTPLVPNLFGDLDNNAAAISMAFQASFPFPGLTETGPFGTPDIATTSFYSEMVAGAYVLAGPSGFATVDVTTTSAVGTPDTMNFPVIRIVPVSLAATSRMIMLDASQSFSPTGGPLTFSWTSPSGASIANANTPTPTVTFPTSGPFNVQLTVTDASGIQSSVSLPFVFVGQ
ncbi:MAG TPA: PKD domain-containing protein [Bryobacteraceae bacterium]|nr:PKD domain-containing protein [Bryobacteraceae bacterium]HPQ17075.1 PKD domain-containing protein [Bryobacteraceae bacterium]HPU71934.1 PKD domain-containing protein [Bryobacteraceae bacterium]